MSRLDDLLPEYDAVERHERRVPAPPADAVAAALAMPVAPDRVVRTLFRLRGLPGDRSVDESLRAMRFTELVREPECVVLGAAGRPWHPRGRIVPYGTAGPGEVRMLLEISATVAGGGALLYTETRVAATDERSRRAFRRYWRAVGPFSGAIRNRWLAAAERAMR